MIIKDTRILRSYKIPNHELQLFKETDRDVEEVTNTWIEQVGTGVFETVETENSTTEEREIMEEVEKSETIEVIKSYTYKFLILPWRAEFEDTYVAGEMREEPVFVDFVEENFETLWLEAEELENTKQIEAEYEETLRYVELEIESTNVFDLEAYRRMVTNNGDMIEEMDSYRDDMLVIRQELVNSLNKKKLYIKKNQLPKKPTWTTKY